VPPDTAAAREVAVEDVLGHRQSGAFGNLLASQAFWVTVALAVLVAGMSWLQPQAFASADNFYNITRNFSFIGIMAVGMTAVIITGGIDLSVGSVMGAVAVVAGTIMHAGLAWPLAVLGGLAAGFTFGLINGVLVAYVGLSSFVVTLGTLAIGRSFAVVLSRNKMIYEFGQHSEAFFNFGGGEWLGLAVSVWFLLALAAVFGLALHLTVWGRHLFGVGGNENAARLTGVPVESIKVQAFVFSGLCAAIAGLLSLAWQGSAINGLGEGYELRVIAAAVIGGANLLGGEGGAYGAIIGAALIEVIRNGLLMAGVDSNWQGMFVGTFIIAAVVLERVRRLRRK
jgi:ribose transport system permease protein